MKIRNLLIITICLFVITGCKIQSIDNKNIVDNVDNLLKNKIKYSNQNAVGYQYYLPNYIKVNNVNDFNQELYYSGKKMYLYTDVVSYYHKIKNSYKVDKNAYISKSYQNGNKYGYLEVNKVKDKYYVEMMYNYAKIETYVTESELNDSLVSMAYVLSSIKYNDNIIETILGDSRYDLSNNETYNIFETKKNNNSNFLDWVNEYDNYNGTDVTESLIEKNDISTTKED